MSYSYDNTVEKFRQRFLGVRQNRFMVVPQWPSGLVGPDEKFTSVYVKAADIPEASIGVITVPWMGRAIKFSGERTYVDWAIQVYESNDSANDLRKLFEAWMELMDQRNEHKINYDVATDWEVWYNDMVPGNKESSTTFSRGIRLKKCFPVNVGTVSMDYDIADSFSVFPITLAYDYWEPLGDLANLSANTGAASGGGIPPLLERQ